MHGNHCQEMHMTTITIKYSNRLVIATNLTTSQLASLMTNFLLTRDSTQSIGACVSLVPPVMDVDVVSRQREPRAQPLLAERTDIGVPLRPVGGHPLAEVGPAQLTYLVTPARRQTALSVQQEAVIGDEKQSLA